MAIIELTPSVVWGNGNKVNVRVTDTTKTATDSPLTATITQVGSSSNTISVELMWEAVSSSFKGSFTVNNTGSTNDPTDSIVLTANEQLRAQYGAAQTLALYYLEEPPKDGYYVEVRTSVRNLHWDLVNIFTKAGWKFVETLPPTVDQLLGHVTGFRHILKTVNTPVLHDGKLVAPEMFILIEHVNYPGNNSGNFKEIKFQLAPNYYYHDKSVMGTDPETQRSEVLWTDGTNLSKCLELPSNPIAVNFIPQAVSSTTPYILDIPINIWGYASRDFFSLVLQGEPSLSTDSFGTVSHIYGGRIESYKEGRQDVGGNFALSGSSLTPSTGTRYGTSTADGTNNIAMYRTSGGLLWQKHWVNTNYDDPQGDSKKSELYQPSAYTSKFHLAPIGVFGPDGKRGYLRDMLAVQKQGILHLDTLDVIRAVDECNPCAINASGEKIDPNDTDNAEWAEFWKIEKFKYFRLTSSNHFLKSFGVADQYSGLGIAVKMEQSPAKSIKFNTSYDIVTGTGVNSWTGIGAVPQGAELAGARTRPITMGSVTV
jgi:hypothetical protein